MKLPVTCTLPSEKGLTTCKLNGEKGQANFRNVQNLTLCHLSCDLIQALWFNLAITAIEPIRNLKLFLVSSILGNTRVITQNNLQKFQKEIGNVMKDPYQVVLKTSKLPLSLLHDRAKVNFENMHLENDCCKTVMRGLFAFSLRDSTYWIRRASGQPLVKKPPERDLLWNMLIWKLSLPRYCI